MHGQAPARRRPRLSIKVRLSLAVAAIIAVTVAVLTLVIMDRQREQFYRQSLRTGSITLNHFAASAIIPLISDDALTLNKMIAEASSVDGLLYAVIEDRHGLVAAHTDHDLIGTRLPPKVAELHSEGDIDYFVYPFGQDQMAMELSMPIHFKDKHLGVAHVGLSVDYIEAAILENALSLAAVGAVILVLGVGVAVLLGFGFSRPVDALAAAAGKLADGNLSHRITLRRNDELGDLSKSFNTMAEELEKKFHMQQSFGCYVSAEVVDMILANPDGAWLKGQRREATVLFVDIRGFTAYSEKTNPEKVVEHLNEFFNIATRAVLNHGGHVDKFIGDALLAVFGAPAPKPDHVDRALQAACELQRSLQQAAAGSDNPFLTKAGVSVSTGEVVSGNIGSREKMEYTVIGDTVNVAVRLNRLAGPGEIIITGGVERDSSAWVRTASLPDAEIRGKTATVCIYRLLYER